MHARDALVLIDLDTDRILRWNPAAERLFGYAAEDVIGRDVELVMPPGLAHLHRARMAYYRRSGDTSDLLDRPLSVFALHRSGAELRVELSVTPLARPGARLSWALLAFRDASSQQQLELASTGAAHTEATTRQLETQLQQCQQLLRETTRELAEPLARARRAASRLARLSCDGRAPTPERLGLLAQVVEAHARDVQQALEHIGTIATIYDGAFEIRADRVNLVPLVGRVVADMRASVPRHHLKLSAPQGLTAMCDASRVATVVVDLIDRAVRRNPRGCWIDVDLRRPLSGMAQIEVRDYGRRVSARERARLADGHDGGWFINRHVLEQHGGTLSLEYPPEGGVRVALSLPTRRCKLTAVSG
jgi:two-component system sensor kinase FixL